MTLGDGTWPATSTNRESLTGGLCVLSLSGKDFSEKRPRTTRSRNRVPPVELMFFLNLCIFQPEGLVEDPHRQFRVFLFYGTRDLDL